MNKQLLSNFQAENLSDGKQLEAEVKNRAAYIKKVSGKFFKMGGGTEKGQFCIGYGQKLQSRNPVEYFIMTKQIASNISSFILINVCI